MRRKRREIAVTIWLAWRVTLRIRSIPARSVPYTAKVFGRRCDHRHPGGSRAPSRRALSGQALRGGQPRILAPGPVSPHRGIHLTGVAWVGGAASSRRVLPEVNGGVPGLVPHRRGLPGLPGVAALAGRFQLPALRGRHGLAAWRWPLRMRRVQLADLGDGGHDIRPDADAADRMVHRVLAVRHAEGRHLGAEPAAVPGDRLVPDRVGDAGPAAVGAGAPGPGPAVRHGGGGRDLYRWR